MSIYYRTAAEDMAILRNEGRTPADPEPTGRPGNVVIRTQPGSGSDTSAIPCPSHVRDGSREAYVPRS